MNFRYIFLIVILCFQSVLYAQRERVQTFDASGIKFIQLKADEVFKIEIETKASAENIQLFTISEGEYFNDIALSVERDLNHLQITSTYKEILTSGYDKLSAHKVYAVNLKLIIPEGLQLTIISNIANVQAKGIFNFFEAELKSGACQLTSFTGKALVNTFTGDVSIQTTQAKVVASSNRGKVEIDHELDFGELIEVKSIYGSILVTKTQ